MNFLVRIEEFQFFFNKKFGSIVNKAVNIFVLLYKMYRD